MNSINTLTPLTWYRFNERTGDRQIFRVMIPPTWIGGLEFAHDSRYFTKAGQPRRTIKVKGKSYFLEK